MLLLQCFCHDTRGLTRPDPALSSTVDTPELSISRARKYPGYAWLHCTLASYLTTCRPKCETCRNAWMNKPS